MKAIIFGINGQDGYYLRKLLQDKHYEVIGISRSEGDWLRGDISDFKFVDDLIKTNQPEFVFHFAANSTTKHEVLYENHDSIATGTLNILESVKNNSHKTKVFLSGSALLFKNEGKPIKETDEFDPRDIYSVQRIYSVYTARYYRKLGIKVYIGYFFHHDSPLRPERHLNMKIIAAAKRIKAGSNEYIEIGNPEVIKEYNHAADLIQAIWILVNQENIYEAVIGNGKGYSVYRWIEECEKIMSIELISKIKIDPQFKTPFSSLVCNPSTLHQIGWRSNNSIHKLAKDMIGIIENINVIP